MSLVNYSSSSSASESDGEVSEPKQKISKRDKESHTRLSNPKPLPNALALLGAVKPCTDMAEEIVDDPAEHGGRIRTFQHERGNWATYVYIPVCSSIFEDVQELCQSAFDDIAALQLSNKLHISLSRTAVLQFHQVDPFAQSIKEATLSCSSFNVSFRELKIYTNDERTRTFIAFKADSAYDERFHGLIRKVDAVMRDFRLPHFYEDPSYHISFLWCVGDKLDVLKANFAVLETAIQSLGERNTFSINIHEIRCKSGNKEFKFSFK